MCIIEETVDLNKILDYYLERIERDKKNITRIKKFYNDEETFDNLMNRIIQKDIKRFEKLSIRKSTLDPFRILYIIMDIAQSEGEEINPFDTLTKNFSSFSMLYRGWTFSWVHGVGTVISIYNRENELVYRF